MCISEDIINMSLDEKRQKYCNRSYSTVQQISTWASSDPGEHPTVILSDKPGLEKKNPSSKTSAPSVPSRLSFTFNLKEILVYFLLTYADIHYKADLKLNNKISLYSGSMTSLEVDVIVATTDDKLEVTRCNEIFIFDVVTQYV